MVASSLRIVAIGGSAGALEALQKIFKSPDLNRSVAYIVVVHHSPEFGTVLDSLLSNWSSMPAQLIDDGTPIKNGSIYVARPGQYVRVEGQILHSALRGDDFGRYHPIDSLFTSLASDAGSGIVAMLLSGTGNDGAAGALKIHQAGGRILAQHPESCAYDAMPSAVIRSAIADTILRPEEMASALAESVFVQKEQKPGAAPDNGTAAVEAILQLVRDHTGNDMSGYKPTTLRRRIERRAGLNHLTDLSAYQAMLRQAPAELDRLAKDMLIGVTGFFRDAEAFEILQKEIIPGLCSTKTPGEPIRVWIAGCSTGEEAYSIAMLLLDWFSAHRTSPRMQIFATDIDDAALEAARAGVYSHEMVRDIPKDRLGRYFREGKGGYAILKSVRETIVFASHNLISDPPFSRLDLVVCRNVLIYLNADTQRKLLALFHFVLNPSGYLFLGSSESVGSENQHFEPVSKQWRLYRHVGIGAPKQPPKLPISGTTVARRLASGGEISTDIGSLAGQERIYRKLIDANGPTLLLVNSRFEILYVAGDSTPYLEYPKGEPSHDLFRIVRPALRVALRSAANRALRDGAKATTSVVPADEEEGAGAPGIRISVTPVKDAADENLQLVSFELDSELRATLPLAGQGGDDWLLQQMEQELNATREDLQRTIERMRISNEETKAANEEIMAMNEELQSSNEELESSKEELQSLNEELATSNAELDNKVNELESTNSDLNNLLLSTDTPTIFLDRELRIRRFTTACTQLMRVIPADVGRSLGDIVQTTGDKDLIDVCTQVLSGLPVEDREVQNAAGRWYLRRILPYRAQDGVIRGVVLTYPDITQVKEGEAELARRNEQLEWQAGLLQEAPVFARDMKDRIIFWNPGAEALYGWTRDEAMNHVSHELLKSKLEIPLDQIKAILNERGTWSGKITHTCRDGRQVVVKSVWTVRHGQNGAGDTAIIEVNNDITDLTSAEAQLIEYRDHLEDLVGKRTAELDQARKAAEVASEAKSAFLANMSHELRTPLQTIIGSAQLIRRDGLSEHQADLFDKVETASVHLLEVIDAILELSKIEADKLSLAEVPVDIGAILKSVTSMLHDRAASKHLQFHTQIDAVPSNLIGDPGRLRQCLLNYAANAVKFTNSGTVTLRVVIADDDDASTLLRFEVIDTGVGISPEALGRLFNAFEQADNSLAREYGGTGLGLTITRKLARQMGGEAGASSTLGSGSTFWFTARLKKSNAALASPEDRKRDVSADILMRDFAGKRILLVEDEPSNRKLFEAMLQAVKLVPTTAEDGLRAIEQVSQNRFDLILMDVQMARMDGLEATRRIRQLPNGRDVPIVAMTGNALATDKPRCLDAGMNDVLHKPVQIQVLNDTVARWLSGGHTESGRTGG